MSGLEEVTNNSFCTIQIKSKSQFWGMFSLKAGTSFTAKVTHVQLSNFILTHANVSSKILLLIIFAAFEVVCFGWTIDIFTVDKSTSGFCLYLLIPKLWDVNKLTWGNIIDPTQIIEKPSLSLKLLPLDLIEVPSNWSCTQFTFKKNCQCLAKAIAELLELINSLCRIAITLVYANTLPTVLLCLD